MSNQAVNKPKLMLFAFQLRNNLALGDEPVKEADALWWDKCKEIGKKIHAPSLEFSKQDFKTYNDKIGVPPEHYNPSSDYLELLKERSLKFTAIPDKCKGELKGTIYPVQIHDTYAVDITLRYLAQNINIQQLSYLNYQGCLLPSQINASLGQTLLLFVQPVDENSSDFKSFANNCLNAILSTAQERLSVPMLGEGKFLGSPIFEYESNQDNLTNLTKNIHILIWLNCGRTTDLEEKGDYYQPLINLLICRHKILYAYSQARWCNQQARSIYKNLEANVKTFSPSSNTKDKLSFFKERLREIPQTAFEYANYIRDIQIHCTTIETNKTNYEYWLGKLHDIRLKDCDDLEVWRQFIKHTQDKFIAQIKTDLNYLTPGQQLFEQMVATIRGIVEIEQAEQDRSLEDTIQIVGVGLGAGAIVSGVVTQDINKPFTIFLNKPLHPIVTSLFWSFVATLFFGSLAWCWTQRTRNK